MTAIEDLLDGGAACVGGDRALWFAHTKTQPRQTATARAICRGCPVRVQCLDYALSRRIWNGMWGGLTAEERRDPQLVAQVRGAA